MSNGESRTPTPHGEGQPYKIDTTPIPLDVLSEYGPGTGECWYRLPSWRVHFDCEALKGVDVRLHRAVGSHAVWTLTEATTGFKMFGDMPHDYYIGDEGAMLAEFCAGMMLKLTPEKVANAIGMAKETLKKRPPNPFGVSETSSSDAQDAARYRWLRDRNPNQLHLTRNEHASNYCTAKQWIEDLPDLFEDDPGIAREAMKAADTIWALQIYPDTPVGFNVMHRATLDELIDEAIKEGM